MGCLCFAFPGQCLFITKTVKKSYPQGRPSWRLSTYLSYLYHYHDKMPDEKQLSGRMVPLAFGVRAQSITAEEVRWQEHEVTGPSASAVRSWCPPYGFHSIWTPVHGMMLSTLMLFLLHGISLEMPSQTHPDVCLLCDSKSTQGDKEGGHYKLLAQVSPASSWLTSVQCCVHSSWSL